MKNHIDASLSNTQGTQSIGKDEAFKKFLHSLPYHIQTTGSAGLIPEEIIKNPHDFRMTSDVRNILG
jgi:hypothetical protein